MLINLSLEKMLEIFVNEVNDINFGLQNTLYNYYSLLGSDVFTGHPTCNDKKEKIKGNPTLTLNDIFKEWREQHDDFENMNLIYQKLRFALRNKIIDTNKDQKIFSLEPENNILVDCLTLVVAMHYNDSNSLLSDDAFMSYDKAKEICIEAKKDPHIKNILEKLIIENIYETSDEEKNKNKQEQVCKTGLEHIFTHDDISSSLNIFLEATILENLFDMDFNLPRNRTILYRKHRLFKEDEDKKLNIIKGDGFSVHYPNVYTGIMEKHNRFLIIMLLAYYINRNFMNDIEWNTLTEDDYKAIKLDAHRFIVYSEENRKEIQNFRNYLDTLNDNVIQTVAYIIDECLLELDI